MKITKGARERFFNKVMTIPFHSCWEWTGALSSKGYGNMKINKDKTDRAHRISYKIHKGYIPKGMHVLHKCDNPSCVNPDHLFLGTNSDNVADMMSKGRRKPTFGEDNPNGKLTEADVLKIRELLKIKPQSEIGDMYGIHQVMVSRIKLRKAWSHI